MIRLFYRIVVIITLVICYFGSSAQHVVRAIQAGSTGGNSANGISVDKSKNLYFGVNNWRATYFGSPFSFNSGCSQVPRMGKQVTIGKLDSDGNCVSYSYWGRRDNIIECSHIDDSSYIYNAGSFAGTDTFGSDPHTAPGLSCGIITKQNSAGTFLKTIRLNSLKTSTIYNITTDHLFNIYITGKFDSTIIFGSDTFYSAGSYDGFIAKYDKDGSCIWARVLKSINEDVIFAVSNIVDGKFYIGGGYGNKAYFGVDSLLPHNQGDLFFAKMDVDGNISWVKNAYSAGPEWIYDIVQDKDENIFVGGRCRTGTIFGTLNVNFGSGFNGNFLARYNSSGTILWVKPAGYMWSGGFAGMTIIDSTIYIGGTLSASTKIGPDTIILNGNNDVFFARADYSGKFLSAGNFGSSDNDLCQGMAWDKDGAIYLTMNFAGTANFGSTSLTAIGSADVAVIKIMPVLPIYGVGQNTRQLCGSQAFTVAFGKNKSFNLGNVFTVQLSDTNGGFTNPVSIGSLTDTIADTIVCVIPDSIKSNSKYRIRMVASNPSTRGDELPYNFSITQRDASTNGGIITVSADTIFDSTAVVIHVAGTSGTKKWQKKTGSGNWIDVTGWPDPQPDSLTETSLTEKTSYRVIATKGACSWDTSDIKDVFVCPTLSCPPALVPDSIYASVDSVYAGDTVTLTLSQLPVYQVQWFSDSCGGTLIGSGPEISVAIDSPAIFYVRNITLCGTGFCAIPDTSVCIQKSIGIIPDILAVSESIEHATCGENIGAISLEVTNGRPPYRFHWSTGDTVKDIDSLAAGIYTVTVTSFADTIIRDIVIGNEIVFDSIYIIEEDTDCVVCTGLGGFASSVNTLLQGENGWVCFDIPADNAGGLIFNCQSTLTQGEAIEDVSVTLYNKIKVESTEFPKVIIGDYDTTRFYQFCIHFTGDSVIVEQRDSTGYMEARLARYLHRSSDYRYEINAYKGCAVSNMLTSAGCSKMRSRFEVVAANGVSNKGSVKAIVKGGTPPYTYSWSGGDTTDVVDSITPGNYTITISDNSSQTITNRVFVGANVKWKMLEAMEETENHELININTELGINAAMGRNGIAHDKIGTISFEIPRSDGNTVAIGFISDRNFNNDSRGLALGILPQDISAFSDIYNPIYAENEPSIYNIDMEHDGNVEQLFTLPPDYPFTITMRKDTDSISVFCNNVLRLTKPLHTNKMLYPVVAFGKPGGKVNRIMCDFGVPLQIGSSSVTHHSGCGQPDMGGAISVSVLGGTPPYNYLWSSGGSSPVKSGLAIGNYTITITDAALDTIVKEFTIYNKLAWDTLINFGEGGDSVINLTSSSGMFANRAIGLNGLGAGQNGKYTFEIPAGRNFQGAVMMSHTQNFDEGDQGFGLLVVENYLLLAGVGTSGDGSVFIGEYDSTRCYKFVVSVSGDSIYVERYDCENESPEFTTVEFLNRPHNYRMVVLGFTAGATVKNLFSNFGCSVLSASILVTPANNISSKGSVRTRVSGGQPPYHYNWSTGDTTAWVDSVAISDYSVTITDQDGDSIVTQALVGAWATWCSLHNVEETPEHKLIALVTNDLENDEGVGDEFNYAYGANVLPEGESGAIMFELADGGSMLGLFGLASGFDGTMKAAAGLAIMVVPEGYIEGEGSLQDYGNSSLYLTSDDEPMFLGTGNKGVPLNLVLIKTSDEFYIYINGRYAATVPFTEMLDLHPVVFPLREGAAVDRVTISFGLQDIEDILPGIITADYDTICLNGLAILTVDSIPDADNYWYSDSCNGQFIGQGFSLAVNIASTTTYYSKRVHRCLTRDTAYVNGQPCSPAYLIAVDTSRPCAGDSILVDITRITRDSFLVQMPGMLQKFFSGEVIKLRPAAQSGSFEVTLSGTNHSFDINLSISSNLNILNEEILEDTVIRESDTIFLSRIDGKTYSLYPISKDTTLDSYSIKLKDGIQIDPFDSINDLMKIKVKNPTAGSNLIIKNIKGETVVSATNSTGNYTWDGKVGDIIQWGGYRYYLTIGSSVFEGNIIVDYEN